MRKIIYSTIIMIAVILALSISAYANTDNSYLNGTDTYSDGVVDFYSNIDDENKLYKLNLSDMTEEKVLNEHIISMVNKDQYLYLLTCEDEKSNLLKFNMQDNSVSIEKSFSSFVTNIALRDSILYYVEEQNIFTYNLQTKENSIFIENENIDFIYFTEWNTLKYLVKNGSKYDTKIYDFNAKATEQNEVSFFSLQSGSEISLMSVSSYSPRLSAPSTTNSYYIHTSYGGLNECIHISGGSVLPNCVGYAWGRSYENLGYRPNLSKGDAGTWYDYNINNGYYPYGKTPYLGAVAVWKKTGGAGHVAVVEVIDGDVVITSESGYNSSRWWKTTRSASNSNFSASSSYIFQGFIYVCGKNSSANTEPPTNVGMICNYENMTVNPGTQIQLDFWYTNGDSFDIVIDKDGVEYQHFNNVSSPFYYTPTEKGDYLARGYAKNNVGSTESNRRKFYVRYIDAPTSVGMICNYENMTVNPGTQIQLDFWYTNGDSFDIVIDKDGVEYQRFNNVSSPFYYTPTEEGSYLARGYAKNDAGSTESNRRAFYISYSEPPTNVGMICNYENMTVTPGTAIQLSYWYTNATQFDLIIYKDDVEYERFDDIGNPFYYVPSEGGNYLAVGYAKNKAGATESNRRSFYISEYTPPIIPNGTYSILSAIDTSYALNVYARDTSDNNTIIIWQDPTQKFDIEYLGGGLYKITSAVTGKVLDAKEAQRVDGTDLVQYTWNEWIGQKWKIERSEDEYFHIINCYNGLYVDLAGGNVGNGTNVQLYSKNSTDAQKWLFSPLIYNITFNANGGTTSITNKSITYNSPYGTLPIPIRNGYEFKGWYTDKTGGSEITSETIVNTTSDITLYAQWEVVIPYTEATVTKSGTKLIVETKVHNITDPYDILIAGYKGNRLVTMKKVASNEQNSPYTLEGDIDEIKVMVWDGLSTLKPLCDAEEIPSSKWIIE